MATLARGNEDAVAERLTALGLPLDAARTYVFMTEQPGTGPAEVGEALHLDDAAVSGALATLLDLSLVLRLPATGEFRCISPRAALGRLLDEQARRLREDELRLLDAKREATLLAERMISHHTPAGGVSSPRGGDPRVSVFDMTAEAQESIWNVLVSLPEPGMLRAAESWDREFLQRGLELRLLVMAGHLRRSRDFLDHARRLREAGADVRAIVTAPTRLVVIDRSAAIIPAADGAEVPAPVLSEDPATVAIAIRLFEELWSRSLTLEEALGHEVDTDSVESSEGQLTPLERSILELMAQGEKDEAVARRVGMSLRAVRRVIARLTDEAGAESRFAFGAECARRGWI